MYYTLKEVASILGKSERQIKYMIKNGIIRPVNKDTYRRDGGYRFSKEHILEVQQKISPSGIKLKEAAAIVGITPQYLSKLSLEGFVESQLVEIGKRTERRFKLEDLHKLKDYLKQNKYNQYQEFGKRLHLFKNNHRLFELVNYKGQPSRIISTYPLMLLTPNGSKNTVEQNFHCSSWPEKPYITKKGFISLEIPIPNNPEHPTYNIIYKLIEGLGEKNVQIYERETGDYYIRVRQGKLYLPKDEYDFLKRYVVDGKVERNDDGEVILSTGIVSQYVHMPEKTYMKLTEYAEENNLNVQDCIVMLLEKCLDV